MQHLVGRQLPDVMLPSTAGVSEMPARISGPCVIFCYPWTGRPGQPNPPDWDAIPGAHGSTPQAQAYSKACESYRILGVKLFGLSFQDTEWQQEFVQRSQLAFALLSDANREFSNALNLPVFTTGGVDYLQRLTLVTRDGVIAALRLPALYPEKDAEETLLLCKFWLSGV